MRRMIATGAVFLVYACAFVNAQTAAQIQTPRQALLEMLLARNPALFEKHLPPKTLKLIREADDLPLRDLLTATQQLQPNDDRTLETFDDGPKLFVTENRNLKQRIEANVDSEDFRGDEDEMRISIHAEREGHSGDIPFLPVVNCTMKLQGGIWRLTDVSLTVRMPLDDLDFLKDLAAHSRKNMIAETGTSAAAGLRTLNTAEISYAATYESVGFTCSLSDLGGSGDGTPSVQAAMLIDDALASGMKNGYTFLMTGCTGNPVATYQVTAVPQNPGEEARTYCTDQTAVIRYSDYATAPNCLKEGRPLE